jgi:hypothetical protein
VGGHIALLKVVVWHARERAIGILQGQSDEDRRVLIRSLAFSLAIIVATIVLLSVPIFLGVDAWNHPSRIRLAIYPIPQAIPLAIPVGLTLGILAAFRRVASSRRARALVLVLAMASSAASFTMLAWVVPTANQAFQLAMVGRPVVKGLNELTLAELGERLRAGAHAGIALAPPTDNRRLERTYHSRWALSCAPLVLALFAISVTGRRQRGRLALGLIGGASIVGYFALLYSALALQGDHTVPVFAFAWAPNVVFVLMSVALITVGSQRFRSAPKARGNRTLRP